MMYLEKLLLSGILIFFIAVFLNLVAVVTILKIEERSSQKIEQREDSNSGEGKMLSRL